MLRIILKSVYHSEDLQLHTEDYHTLDIEQPELEAILRAGGFGNGGYERTGVAGVEIIEPVR